MQHPVPDAVAAGTRPKKKSRDVLFAPCIFAATTKHPNYAYQQKTLAARFFATNGAHYVGYRGQWAAFCRQN
jgi:hypothetical protein